MGLEFDICQTKLWNLFFFFSVESLTLTKMDRLTTHATHKNHRNLLHLMVTLP